MTTFLSALRFAVNIETDLTRLQVTRFRQAGDTSTRLLPPLVPICFLQNLPSEAELDAVRRTHRVDLHRYFHTSPPLPPTIAGAYRLEFDGFLDLLSDIMARWVPDTFPPATEGSAVTICDTGERSPRFAEPAVYLGWAAPPTNGPPPIALPNTQAMWLSIFRLEYTDSPRWWSDASWDLVYSRRCTNRRER